MAAISTAAAPPVDAKASDKPKEAVTPQAPPPPADKDGVAKEEKVEFRDQDGNILNEDQVKELEGKVSFSTRYETRTRYMDAQGKEVVETVKDVEEKKAPHQPEVERVPETPESPEGEGGKAAPAPASVSPKGEEKAKEGEQKKPKPASSGEAAATGKESAKQ